MADRVLTWYVPTPIEVGESVRETYELDDDYVPIRVWLHAGRAPTGTNIVIDINAEYEGTKASIFTAPRPGVQTGSQFGERDYFKDPRLLKKGAYITLDIDQIGSAEGGKALTIQLELDRD